MIRSMGRRYLSPLVSLRPCPKCPMASVRRTSQHSAAAAASAAVISLASSAKRGELTPTQLAVRPKDSRAPQITERTFAVPLFFVRRPGFDARGRQVGTIARSGDASRGFVTPLYTCLPDRASPARWCVVIEAVAPIAVIGRFARLNYLDPHGHHPAGQSRGASDANNTDDRKESPAGRDSLNSSRAKKTRGITPGTDAACSPR